MDREARRYTVGMDETETKEARTRAAIRVAHRLGAGVDELHDVLIAVRAGWTAAAERDSTLTDALTKACDEAWRAHGGAYAPARSKMALSLLAAMWPDVIVDCAREEEQVRKERLRQAERADERVPTAEEYSRVAQHYEGRGDVNRAALYREAAAVMAKGLPSTQ